MKAGQARRVRDLWARLAMYMPMLLMGVLALGTYWLVRNAPLPTAPEAAHAAGHAVDYFMRGFSVRNFDDAGRLKSEVTGREGRHFPDTDILEVDDARVRSLTPEGRVTVATGKRAYSNGDGSEVQLVGNAVVVREASVDVSGRPLPRLEFRGEFLHAFLNEERVTSHQPVLLIRGNDQFTADAFDYSNFDQVVDLRGRVRGVINAKPAVGSP